MPKRGHRHASSCSATLPPPTPIKLGPRAGWMPGSRWSPVRASEAVNPVGMGRGRCRLMVRCQAKRRWRGRSRRWRASRKHRPPSRRRRWCRRVRRDRFRRSPSHLRRPPPLVTSVGRRPRRGARLRWLGSPRRQEVSKRHRPPQRRHRPRRSVRQGRFSRSPRHPRLLVGPHRQRAVRRRRRRLKPVRRALCRRVGVGCRPRLIPPRYRLTRMSPLRPKSRHRREGRPRRQELSRRHRAWAPRRPQPGPRRPPVWLPIPWVGRRCPPIPVAGHRRLL
jgi:hypothetical protein